MYELQGLWGGQKASVDRSLGVHIGISKEVGYSWVWEDKAATIHMSEAEYHSLMSRFDSNSENSILESGLQVEEKVYPLR